MHLAAVSASLVCSVTDWIQAGAVVAGVIAAWLGLGTWKAQLSWTRNQDAALGLLERALAVRDALRDLRRANRFWGPAGTLQDAGGTLARVTVEDARSALAQMEAPLADVMRAFDVARVRAEAVLGTASVGSVVNPVRQVVSRVRYAVREDVLSSVKGSSEPRPSPERYELANWAHDDPEHDTGTRVVLDAFEPVERWAREVLG